MSIVRNGIAALLMGAAAVSAVAEEEPAKHKLELSRSQWTAGDTFTCSKTQTGKQQVDMVAPDGTKTMMQTSDDDIRFEAVVKAVEVDENGKRTKCHVHFKSWKHKSVGQNMMMGQTEPVEKTDESLGGVTIEVSGGEWTELSEGSSLSMKAKEFLKESFIKTEIVDDSFDLLAASSPKEPVQIGATWKPETAPFTEQFAFTTPFDLRADKTTVTLTLDGVEKKDGVERATLSSKFSFSLKTVTNAGMPIPLGEKSDFVITQKETVALSGKLRFPERTSSFESKGDGDFQGMAFEYAGSGTEKLTTKPGGEIPEPKKKEEKPAEGGVPNDPGTE